jgi:CMP/dCMP kinase
MKKIIVAIDGFSSCGKSTIAKALASKMGYIYVDTGAMYRAVSLFCMQNGWLTASDFDLAAIEANIQNAVLHFETNAEGKSEIFLNGKNVETNIRTLEVANGASRVSTIAAVRSALVHQQQQMGLQKGIVMDGRDIGTVVFPEAELKIFLTASPQIRAQRRFDELKAANPTLSFDEVFANVNERDFRDQNRTESPLKQAADAIVIDNSTMSMDQQQAYVEQLFQQKIAE